MKVRLQKFLAEAGVASRRSSEQIILDGKVTVNGQTVSELGAKIDPDQDRITFEGRLLKPKKKLYIALHKPSGYVCSRVDPENRRTVGDLLPKEWKDLPTVGRLDYKTEGLIFLTNDGELALRLTHPRYGVQKKYIATIPAKVPPEVLQKIMRGVFHDGERLKADFARFLHSSNSQAVVELELSEGKNREVRRLFEACGFIVGKLERVQIGPIKLGELPSGRWRALTDVEVKNLFRASEKSAEKTPPAPRSAPKAKSAPRVREH